MFFGKKEQQKPAAPVKQPKPAKPNNIQSVLYVTDILKEYEVKLAAREVDSLSQLSRIGSSFSGVMQEADQFQEKLEQFGQNFSNINQAAEQYANVRESVSQAVDEAQNKVEELKNTSIQVESSFGQMETTFAQLLTAVNSIQQCMSKIVSIADETNILALNASIEAARAGEKGKGFAVVAIKVKELAEEIKDLTKEVNGGIKDVTSGANRLNESILSSRQVLGQSVETANSTYDTFQNITQAADSSVAVQTEISEVIDQSQNALQEVYQFFNEIKESHQEVMQHLRQASNLGTMKSAMFEDVDNMLSQIPPMVKELEQKK